MLKSIDIKFYLAAKPDFLNVLKVRNPLNYEELNREISVYCACTGLPVIVAIEFCIQEFPQYLSQLEQKKVVVKEFYGYE